MFLRVNLSNMDILQVWSERRYGYGAVNFITGAGGFLQAVLYGYGGFRLKDDGLHFKSTLPSRVTKLTLNIHYLGCSLKFEVHGRGVTCTLVANGPISPDLEVARGKHVYALKRGEPVTLKTKQGVVRERVSRVQSEMPQGVKGCHRNV